jgi:hypothetical protein
MFDSHLQRKQDVNILFYETKFHSNIKSKVSFISLLHRLSENLFCNFLFGRSRWRGSGVARLLGLQVRILLTEGISVRVLCIVRQRSLRLADHSSSGVLLAK